MKSVKTVKTGTRKKVTTRPAPAGTRQKLTTAASAKPVTIEARIDVGFGNAVYLRGEGVGLSWNQGIPLTCVDSSTWKWSGEANDALKFKLLLNDAVWAEGQDLIAVPGQKLEVRPRF